MRKPWVIVVGLAVVVGGVWVGASRVIGGMVANEVANLESSLARVNHVQVNRLQYDREWFSGVVHYDLLVRPLPGDALYNAWQEALGAEGTPGVRLQGQLQVQHGPWLGSNRNASNSNSLIGLARATGGLPLPEALRSALPNYPGQRPLMALTATMNLARQVRVTFAGTDYRGPVVAPHTTEQASLVFAGLQGQLEFNSALSHLNATAQLEELALAVAGSEPLSTSVHGLHLGSQLVQANAAWQGSLDGGLSRWAFADDEAKGELGATQFLARLGTRQMAGQPTLPTLQFEGDIAAFNVQTNGKEALQLGAVQVRSQATREWPTLWMGKASVALAESRLDAQGKNIRLGSLLLNVDTQNHGGKVEQAVDLNLGPMAVNGVPLGQEARLRTVLSGMDGDALNALLLDLERLAYDEALLDSSGFQANLQAALAKMLAGQPSFAIDPLALTLQQSNDVTANLSVQFQGASGLSLDDPAALLERVTLDTQSQITSAALRELLRLGRLAETGFALPPDPGSAAGQALAREIDAQYQGFLQMAAQMPYLNVGEQGISLRAQFRDGRLTLNGQPADELLDLLALLDLGGEASAPEQAAGEAAELDWQQPGLFSNLKLAAGFANDPQVVSLMAGGDTWLNGELGPDCVGHVNAEQADVVLHYTAGEWPLAFWAESADDTTLIVRTPNGQWQCNDDAQGINPAVTLNTPQTGNYAIWVGTYNTDTADTTLNISEMPR